MIDLTKFKTAHQIAQELLGGPNRIVIVPTAMFDMPGGFTAYPARVQVTKVENVDVVIIAAAPPQFTPAPPETAPAESKSNG